MFLTPLRQGNHDGNDRKTTDPKPKRETTIKLAYPVRLATGAVLDKVTVRRPRVGDLRAVAHIASEAEQGLALVSQITGLVPRRFGYAGFKRLGAHSSHLSRPK